jgi:hypothetical protein
VFEAELNVVVAFEAELSATELLTSSSSRMIATSAFMMIVAC